MVANLEPAEGIVVAPGQELCPLLDSQPGGAAEYLLPYARWTTMHVHPVNRVLLPHAVTSTLHLGCGTTRLCSSILAGYSDMIDLPNDGMPSIAGGSGSAGPFTCCLLLRCRAVLFQPVSRRNLDALLQLAEGQPSRMALMRGVAGGWRGRHACWRRWPWHAASFAIAPALCPLAAAGVELAMHEASRGNLQGARAAVRQLLRWDAGTRHAH